MMKQRIQHRFLPHTSKDEAEMLQSIGVGSVEELFEVIPEPIRHGEKASFDALSESRLMSEMSRLAQRNQTGGKLFLGAGAYEHYTPSIVWALAGSRASASVLGLPSSPGGSNLVKGALPLSGRSANPASQRRKAVSSAALFLLILPPSDPISQS